MQQIKTSHGLAIIGICFLAVLYFTNSASKEFDSIALSIFPGSQLAQVGGAVTIAVDSVSSGTCASSCAGIAAVSFSHTIGSGTNMILLVGVEQSSNTSDGTPPVVSSVTYNGVNLTQITSRNFSAAPATREDLWYLTNPSSGLHNIVVTTASGISKTLIAAGISFSGVDQSSPIRGTAGSAGNGISASVTIPSVAGDMVVDLVCNGNSIISSSQTQKLIKNVNTSVECNNIGISTAPGSGSVTMSWSVGSDYWLDLAASLKPASGGGTIDTTAPSISGILASSITTSLATISWTTNESSDSQIEYGLTTGYGSQTALNTSLITSHSASLSGLSANTLYHYRVKSKDAAGNLAQSSDQTFTTSTSGGDILPPSAPTGLTATAVSSSQINLSWNASTDNVGVAGYRIYRGGTQIATSLTNSYSNTGLSASTAYSYTVAAYDAVANLSTQSSSASATTLASTTGNTITLNDGNQTTVQNAINSAANGTIIVVPSGNWSWSNLSLNKPIHLKGNGSSNTTITGGSPKISIGKSSSGVIEVSGFTFSGGSQHIYVSGSWSARPFIIHDSVFNMNGGQAFRVETNGGLVYNSTFNGSLNYNDQAVQHKLSNPQGSWTTADTMGMRDTNGENNLYIENSTFNNMPLQAFDFDENARTVVRYSTFINTAISSHGRSTGPASLRHFEVYNNSFTWNPRPLSCSDLGSAASMDYFMFIRGGTGVLADNYFDNINSCYTGDKNEVKFQEQQLRRTSNQFTPDCPTSYPAPQQLGQGHNGVSSITDPVYIWGNTGQSGHNANAASAVDYTPDDCGNNISMVPNFWQANRDYVNNGTAKPGYVKYTYPHPLRSGITPPAGDTTSPSVPTGLSATAVSSSQINLSWNASTDNSGVVAGYRIYRGGTLLTTTTGTSFQNTGLTASTSYSYTVAAYDAVGNASPQSGSASATTLASTPPPTGNTVTLGDGNQTTVQNAINSAVNGTIIVVPSGSWSWSSGISFNKAIKIQGSGAGGLIGYSKSSNSISTGSKTFTAPSGMLLQVGDQVKAIYTSNGAMFMLGTVSSYSGTSLTLNVTSISGSGTFSMWTFSKPSATTITNNFNAGDSGGLLYITESTSASIEVSGIHFVQGNATGAHIAIGTTSSGKPVLIHDNWFSMGGGMRGMRAETNKGIVYNNSFDSGFSSVWPNSNANDEGIVIKPLSLTNSWTTNDTIGTHDTTGTSNFYIEDNYFAGIFLSSMDADDNSRVVIRHNTFDNAATGSHGMDTSPYGVRHFEIYDNTFVFTNAGNDTYNFNWFINVRGGTGVIADNTMADITSQAWSNKSEITLQVQNTRRYTGPYPCVTSYPAPRQVGQSWADGSYITDPLFIWNNSGNPVVGLIEYTPNECGSGAPSVSSFIQSGRDYIIGPKPGYAKYQYPHPLRSGTTSGGDTTSPSVPTGLSATAVSSSQINLSWTASTDNSGVVSGYRIYRGGTLLTTVTGTSYSNTGLTASTSYSYTVAAYDAVGNASPQSGSASATTLAGTTQTYTINITKAGTGSGTVTGTGISCGTDCSEILNAGTSITLSASASTGSNFTSWSGCTSFSGNNCTVIINSNTTATATFNVITTGATTYYVDNNASNDSSPGTQAQPWKHSPGMVGWTGTTILDAGDTVYFDKADTWDIPANTSGPGLEIKAGVHYIGNSWGGTGVRARLRATGDHESGNVRFFADHVTIPTEFEGFEVDGNGYIASGIDINHAHWTTGLTDAVKRIKNVVVHGQKGNGGAGYYKYGIIISDNSPDKSGQVANVEIIDTTVYDVPRSGINLYPGATGKISNITVRGCDVSRPYNDPSYQAATHAIGIKGDVVNSIIENCYTHDIGGSAVFVSGPETGSGIGPTNLTIRNNILSSPAVDGVIRFYKLGAKSADVYGNIVLDNSQTGGLVVGGNSGSLKLSVYNNVFWNTFVDLVGGSQTVTSFEFKNNVIQYSSNQLRNSGIITSQSNNTLTSTNPGFVNPNNKPTGFIGTYGVDYRPNTDGFSLQSSSSLIDAGVALGSAYNKSINSVTRPQGAGWDIGAYEAAGSGGDTSSPSVPTGLSATAVSSSQINLSWNASTDNSGVVAGYRIYRGGTQIATTAGTSYSNTGLTASTSYSYTVAAYDAAGNASAQSGSASAVTLDSTPPVISAINATPLSNSATITWTTNEPATTRIEYGVTTSYGNSTTLNSTLSTSHSQTISSLTTNTLYHYRVISADGAGNSTTSLDQTFTTIDNAPPVISVAGSTITIPDGATSASLTITTDESATCKWGKVANTSYASLPNTFTKSGNTHTTTITNLVLGTNMVYVRCADALGNTNTTDTSITITVTAPVNNAPILGAIGNKTVNENSLLSFTVSATDANGDPLTYSASLLPLGGFPAGASFNSSTRTFSWTPSYNQSGTYNGTFTVNDGRGGVDSETIIITVVNVDRPPVANAGNDQTVTLPDNAVLTGYGSYDPDDSLVVYYMLWSQTSGPSQAVFSMKNIPGPTVSFNGIPGTYVFELTITDPSFSSKDSVTVTVLPAPVITTDSDNDGVVDANDKCPATPTPIASSVNAVGCPLPIATNFTITDLSNVDLNAATTFKIGNSHGSINYAEADGPYTLVKGAGTGRLDIDANVVIAQNSVSLDSVNLSELDKPATITLYNVSISKPQIRRDDSLCDGCTLISFKSKRLVFTVPGFSTYVIEEDTEAPTASVTAPTSGASIIVGTLSLAASANDDFEVGGVYFASNGVPVTGADVEAPYTSSSWQPAVGNHAVEAVAYDVSGNYATSSPVSFTITAAGQPPSTPSGGGGGGGGRRTVTISPITPAVPSKIPGCDNRTTGFSPTTGQSCALNIPTIMNPSYYNFGLVTLRSGSSGEAVKELQRFLNRFLNLGLVVDGKLGPKTIVVIKKWQMDNGLVPDGLVGPKTKAKMNLQVF